MKEDVTVRQKTDIVFPVTLTEFFQQDKKSKNRKN